MYDLATDATSHKLIAEFAEANKIVGAVCHGPAALVNVKLSNGSYLVADKRVTGFTNTEEDQVQLTPYMPFMLETELKAHGGKFEMAAEPWAPHVATDGKLFTGQNPASAAPIGEAIRKAILG